MFLVRVFSELFVVRLDEATCAINFTSNFSRRRPAGCSVRSAVDKEGNSASAVPLSGRRRWGRRRGYVEGLVYISEGWEGGGGGGRGGSSLLRNLPSASLRFFFLSVCFARDLRTLIRSVGGGTLGVFVCLYPRGGGISLG